MKLVFNNNSNLNVLHRCSNWMVRLDCLLQKKKNYYVVRILI